MILRAVRGRASNTAIGGANKDGAKDTLADGDSSS